jgi:hypothetical protein
MPGTRRRLRRLTDAERRKVEQALQQAMSTRATAAGDLYQRLRGLKASEWPRVRKILHRILGTYADEAEAEILSDVSRASNAGARAAAGTWSARIGIGRSRIRAVMRGMGAPAPLPQPGTKGLPRIRLSPLTGRRTAYVLPSGDVWLSRALHSLNAPGSFQGLTDAVDRAIREGTTATELAQRLRDEVGHHVAIGGPPQALVQMEEAAKRALRASGDPAAMAEFQRVRIAARRYAQGLKGGAYSTRAAHLDAVSKIERAVEMSNAAAVTDAVQWWTWNRERTHQRLIARTETVRGYNREYRATAGVFPWVVGFQWNIDPAACEVCIELSQADEHGLGPGGYPKDAYPEMPHPLCCCFPTEIIDEEMEPSEDEWRDLERSIQEEPQPEDEILGQSADA